MDKQVIPMHSIQLLEPEWRKKCELFSHCSIKIMKNLGIDLKKGVSGMCSFRGQRIIKLSVAMDKV
jgi:hypothetical protein